MSAPGSARRSARGLTLVETLIGTTIALILTAGAVTFATQEVRLMEVSQDRIHLARSGRTALSLIAEDVRRAGAGVGYAEDGTFLGLSVGAFDVDGIPFNSEGADSAEGTLELGSHRVNQIGRPNTGLDSYDAPTHDLRVRYAAGSYATVVEERMLVGRLCAGPGISFEEEEVVMIRDAVGISARSGRLELGGMETGAGCPCLGGCLPFVFVPTDHLTTGPGATTVGYGFGEVQGGLRDILWFVLGGPRGGVLRRADVTQAPCMDFETCGDVAVDFADALFVQVWRWNRATGQWAPQGQELPPPDPEARIRVDLELVVRSERQAREGTRQNVVTRLAGPELCLPEGCDEDPDGYARLSFRTSVEVLNSGISRGR